MILNVVYFCEKCEESAGIVVREMDGRKLFYKLLLEQTKCKKVSEIADEMNISKRAFIIILEIWKRICQSMG